MSYPVIETMTDLSAENSKPVIEPQVQDQFRFTAILANEVRAAYANKGNLSLTLIDPKSQRDEVLEILARVKAPVDTAATLDDQVVGLLSKLPAEEAVRLGLNIMQNVPGISIGVRIYNRGSDKSEVSAFYSKAIQALQEASKSEGKIGVSGNNMISGKLTPEEVGKVILVRK